MRTAFLASLLLAALGCSSGGGGGAAPAPGNQVSIVTQALDQGNVDYAFFQQLTATGGQAPYSWWVSTSGDPLPPGLTLTQDGRLAGTPTQPAARTLLIVVQDLGAAFDVVSLPIEVRDVQINGAPGGAVTPGQTLTFSASGGVAQYQFSLPINSSGAQLAGTNYTAGSTAGVDVVRATDADGFWEEVSVTVGDDPFVGFAETWGTTDVWWVNWDAVYDPSPAYATDLDEVLVALGLRHPGSTDALGTEADQLARLLLIRRSLGWLSRFYGNSDNGNPLPGGLSISFVGPQGPSSGTTPSVGAVQPAAPQRYGTICVRYGPTSGVVGTAWLDEANNDSVEHNCGNPSNTPLGAFANRVLSPYLASYNNSIANNPVGPGDVDGLRAMLNGSSPQGSRQQAIYNVADGYGKTLAAVLAHEVGHSLGLSHSSPSGGSGDIMNASLTVAPSIQYAFNGTHWAALQSALPGPNR